MARIIINGETKDVALPVSVSELIRQEGVEQPDMVSVQVNGEFLVRDDFSTRQLAEGDEVDFLYFMGGGSLAPCQSVRQSQ